MNRRMWDNPATIRNVATLREAGHHVLEPTPGASLTSDTIGTGIGEIPGGVLAGVAAHARFRRQTE